MYRIDKSSNNVDKLDERLFKELKIRERDHLQEWIAKNPEMLGEDLLIIQKEFDGFSDTNERLDLPALDKDGRIVVIENKLDDTGRNVVWQALKYASYCSTLTTTQIIKIYQQYLIKSGTDQDAKELLLEFLDRDEEELLLNRQDQRIIFVANHYRKEVTSTVLWLLQHDVKIQCFRATPYSMGDEMYLQMEQIIPLPETEEFMIDAKEKEKEEKGKSKAVAETEAILINFWQRLIKEMKNSDLQPMENIQARPYYYLHYRRENGGIFGFCIGRHAFRVELYFSNDPDKLIIDKMNQYSDEIESGFGRHITWERLEGKKASRIKHDMPEEISSHFEGKFGEGLYWDELIEWFIITMNDFYKVLNPVWESFQRTK